MAIQFKTAWGGYPDVVQNHLHADWDVLPAEYADALRYLQRVENCTCHNELVSLLKEHPPTEHMMNLINSAMLDVMVRAYKDHIRDVWGYGGSVYLYMASSAPGKPQSKQIPPESVLIRATEFLLQRNVPVDEWVVMHAIESGYWEWFRQLLIKCDYVPPAALPFAAANNDIATVNFILFYLGKREWYEWEKASFIAAFRCAVQHNNVAMMHAIHDFYPQSMMKDPAMTALVLRSVSSSSLGSWSVKPRCFILRMMMESFPSDTCNACSWPTIESIRLCYEPN